MNDILNRIPNILSYADDTAIYSTADNWSLAQNELNVSLKLIAKWLANNRLSLNIGKTVFVTFGCYSDSVPETLDLEINGVSIKRVDNCKYLGVHLDCNMRWDVHINYIYNKTKYLVYVLHRLASTMNTETLKVIYYAFYNSIISYGIIAWGGAYENILHIIKNQQNKLVKIINKNTFGRDCPINIEQLFALESISFHYEFLRNKYLESTSITRNKSLALPKTKKKISNKNSYLPAIKIFNMLPTDHKVLRLSKKGIKKRLKLWILNTI